MVFHDPEPGAARSPRVPCQRLLGLPTCQLDIMTIIGRCSDGALPMFTHDSASIAARTSLAAPPACTSRSMAAAMRSSGAHPSVILAPSETSA